MRVLEETELSYTGIVVRSGGRARTIILNTIENTIYRVIAANAGIYTVCNVEENNTLHYVVLVLS